MRTIRQRALVWIGKRVLAAVAPMIFEKLRQSQQPQATKVICGHCGCPKERCRCSNKGV